MKGIWVVSQSIFVILCEWKETYTSLDFFMCPFQDIITLNFTFRNKSFLDSFFNHKTQLGALTGNRGPKFLSIFLLAENVLPTDCPRSFPSVLFAWRTCFAPYFKFISDKNCFFFQQRPVSFLHLRKLTFDAYTVENLKQTNKTNQTNKYIVAPLFVLHR